VSVKREHRSERETPQAAVQDPEIESDNEDVVRVKEDK